MEALPNGGLFISSGPLVMALVEVQDYLRQLGRRDISLAEPGRDYVVLLTEMLLKSYGAIPRFLCITVQIQHALRRAPSLIGHSLLARLSHKRFWTLPVWEDEEVLMAFVSGQPH